MTLSLPPLDVTLDDVEEGIGLHVARAILGIGATKMRGVPADLLPYWEVSSRGDRRYRRGDVIALRDQMRAGAVKL